MKQSPLAGYVGALTASIMFGLIPIFANFAYMAGTNPITLTFGQAMLGAPVLLVLLLVRKTSLSITKQEFIALILTAFGTGTTQLLLFNAYTMIASGVATALHFLYPIVIMICSIVIFKEAPTKIKYVAVALGFMGVALLCDLQGEQNLLGIALALLSSCTYSFYILRIQHSVLCEMDFIKLGFYLALFNACITGTYALATGTLLTNLPLPAIGYTFMMALVTSVVACVLLNFSIVRIGAVSVSMLCVAEPITGVLLSVLLLGEEMTVGKCLGCVAVFCSVGLVSYADFKGAKERTA